MWLRGDNRFCEGVVQLVLFGLIGFCQAGQGNLYIGIAVRQVPAADKFTFRMLGQPALTGTQQLRDLLLGDPVVLRVVQHG
jgi:hypothetical protein